MEKIKLDKYQKKVIKNKSKNLLVIAPAGSGKTFTIIQKIIYLTKNGIKPEEILCISFTKAASLNLKEKLKKENINIDVQTFHSLGNKIIKQTSKKSLVKEEILKNIVESHIDSYNNLSILINAPFIEFGKGESKILKNNILKQTIYKKYIINTIITFINLFKSNNYTIKNFQQFQNQNKKQNNYRKQKRHKEFLKLVKKIYIHYNDYLSSSHQIDFHDMINQATKIIKTEEIYPYKYIIIDEYQDTSLNKCELIKEIQNKTNAKLIAVGDDWQSIYQFTGSNLEIFTNFKKHFKKAKTIKLKYSYRNSNELLKVTSKFIKQNPYQIKKRVKSSKKLPKPITIYYYENINEVWNKITKDIKGKAYILGRNNKDINNLPHIPKNMEFMTIHKSKGLEEEQIILINLESKIDGFPSKIIPSEYLMYVNSNIDKFPYAEERRLFYVALTRTKTNVILLVKKDNPSIFITELVKNYKKHIKIVEKC